jgi:hypothetical protein
MIDAHIIRSTRELGAGISAKLEDTFDNGVETLKANGEESVIQGRAHFVPVNSRRPVLAAPRLTA